MFVCQVILGPLVPPVPLAPLGLTSMADKATTFSTSRVIIIRRSDIDNSKVKVDDYDDDDDDDNENDDDSKRHDEDRG